MQIEKGIKERLEENGIPDPDKTVIEKVLKDKALDWLSTFANP
jgi:hypothetical protein